MLPPQRWGRMGQLRCWLADFLRTKPPHRQQTLLASGAATIEPKRCHDDSRDRRVARRTRPRHPGPARRGLPRPPGAVRCRRPPRPPGDRPSESGVCVLPGAAVPAAGWLAGLPRHGAAVRGGGGPLRGRRPGCGRPTNCGPPRWSRDAALVKQARRLRGTGLTMRQIGEQLGCSAATVYKCVRHG